MDKRDIRHAASVILLRDTAQGPAVLMGQRSKSAAFMPEKFVFPGGAVDADDAQLVPMNMVPASLRAALEWEAKGAQSQAILGAAMRELTEETGLELRTTQDLSAFRFIFRAITPPGRPRRFDARFFLIDASEIDGDLDDFSKACDELSQLQWITLEKTRNFELPFITEIVIAECAAHYAGAPIAPGVPFFDNSGEESEFRRIPMANG